MSILAGLGLLFVVLVAWAAGSVARRAVQSPPLRQAPNTEDYYYEQTFPLVSDPELGVWNRPNHFFTKQTRLPDQTMLRTEVCFDRFGVRVAKATDQTPGQVDLIAVGESNTWGQGLPYESTYPALLGRELGLSAANLALIGSSGVQDLLIMRRFLNRKPKIIVYGLWEEHFTSNIRRCANVDSPVCLPRPVVRGRRDREFISRPRNPSHALAQYLRWSRETMIGRSTPFSRQFYWTARIMLREHLEKRVPALRRASNDWTVLSRQPAWPRMEAAMKFVLSEMMRAANSVSATLIVVYMPFYFTDVVSPPPPAIIDHVKKIGGRLVSMSGVWSKRKAERSDFILPSEGHLNAVGHRDVADAVLAAFGARPRGSDEPLP